MPAGYQTRLESVAITGAADLQIRLLLNGQQFSDPQGTAEGLGVSSALWPLFGQLWPSGAHLAACMAAHVLQPGQRILEVGCGLALASLVGHRRGADMTASDCHPLAAPFLAANLLLNGLPPMKYRHAEWDGARTPAQGPDQNVSTRYELIIGSDVLYDRDASAALASFIERHGTPVGEVWIIDPERGNRAAFSGQLSQQGYRLSQTPIVQLARADAAAYRGRLLRFQRH